MDRCIGLDAHSSSCTAATIGPSRPSPTARGRGWVGGGGGCDRGGGCTAVPPGGEGWGSVPPYRRVGWGGVGACDPRHRILGRNHPIFPR